MLKHFDLPNLIINKNKITKNTYVFHFEKYQSFLQKFIGCSPKQSSY